MAEKQVHNENFRHLVRIANTDLDGNKYPVQALQKIKGVGAMFAHAIVVAAKVDNTKKIGNIDDHSIERLEAVVKEPAKHSLPTWLFNRRFDYETGENQHLITGDLDFAKENDLKRLKKIKSRRGLRHIWGYTLRGQRTKSNFRRNKRKMKGGLGVIRKKVASAAGDKKEGKK